MPNAFLTGQAVYLRPLELSDAPLLVPWFNDPEVIRTLRRYRPMNLPEEEAFIRRLAENDDLIALGIVIRQTDQLIGSTGLHQFNWRCRHAAFGISIGEKSCWGCGYGTEATRLMVEYAFLTLNLNRVSLEVYEYNPRGLHIYEKIGFRQEGRLRQDTFRDGRYWDTIVMGILRDEWLSGPGRTSASNE